jgi:hypothetical protein
MLNLNKYQAVIETRVAGIPAQIGVIEFTSVKGSRSYCAPSDLDFHGYTEAAWELLDRKGYRAAWLDGKADKQSIEQQIINHFDTDGYED